jgi:mannose-6-phosphate isomerase-like protein (cupin superfamily)
VDEFVSRASRVLPAEIEGLFGGQGRFRRWSLFGPLDAPPFTVVAETEMAPGAFVGLHVQPDQQEILYVLEGQGTFRIDGREAAVSQGDAILARAGSNFGLRNTADGPLRYLVIKCKCAP